MPHSQTCPWLSMRESCRYGLYVHKCSSLWSPFQGLVLRRFVAGGVFVLQPLDNPNASSGRPSKAPRTDNGSATAASDCPSTVWSLTVQSLLQVLYDSGTLSAALCGPDDAVARALVPRASNEPLLGFVVAVPGQDLQSRS